MERETGRPSDVALKLGLASRFIDPSKVTSTRDPKPPPTEPPTSHFVDDPGVMVTFRSPPNCSPRANADVRGVVESAPLAPANALASNDTPPERLEGDCCAAACLTQGPSVRTNRHAATMSDFTMPPPLMESIEMAGSTERES